MPESTKEEWEIALPPDDGDLPSATDQSAANLERDLQNERDSRKEERFFWIFLAVMIGNVPLFNSFSSDWALLPAFLLELIFLIGLADWLGVDRVKILLERLYNRFERDN